MEAETESKVISQESIKLTKNSKGYTWEIKLLDKENIENQLERLERINMKMLNGYDIKGVDAE